MTFFRKPLMLKLSRFWREHPEIALPLVFFSVMLIHASRIWLTDDEAYYWVLAQKPAWGYAYHPPAVAWLIALSEVILRHSGPWVVRLPGVGCMALTLALAMRWLKRVGVVSEKLLSSGGLLLSFAGIFSLSWMMVPDLPLFLGWTLAFVSVWDLCFIKEEGVRPYLGLAGGLALALLSKYSAILAVSSAMVALVLWGPRERRLKGMVALFIGTCLGIFPTLFWNAHHEWSSLLWQIRDRHHGEGGAWTISWIRYLRYWAIELLAAGVVLVPFSFWVVVQSFRKESQSYYRYASVWMIPAAAVFCLQPWVADFKPHWSFIVWWPAALILAIELKSPRWRAVQWIHGWSLGILVLLSCHFPLLSFFTPGIRENPRLDVSNDLYGWRDLPGFLDQHSERELIQKLPVVGSRYQTASQAAFALRGRSQVTLIPTDLKSREEWPDLHVSVGKEGQWPRLRSPVLFVGDNRYDAPPEFSEAFCQPLGRLDAHRWENLAKSILLWKCVPAKE